MNTSALPAAQGCADANMKTTNRFSLVFSGHYRCHEDNDLPEWPSRRFATATIGRCASLGEACVMALYAMPRKHFVLAAQEGHADGLPFETASFRPSMATVYDLRGHKVLIGFIGCWLNTLHWFEPAVFSDEIRMLGEAARNLRHAADYQHGRGNTGTALALREQACDLLHHLVSRPWAALACDVLKAAARNDDRVKVTRIAFSLAQAKQAFQEQYEMPVTQRYFGSQPACSQHTEQAFA